MERLVDEGVVRGDSLSFAEIARPGSHDLEIVWIEGTLGCSYGIAVRVRKRLAVRRGLNNRYEVRTVHWQYHAWLRGGAGQPRRDLLRYDTNPHRPELHAHLYDESGREVASPDVRVEEMPTLDAFVRHVVAAVASAR